MLWLLLSKMLGCVVSGNDLLGVVSQLSLKLKINFKFYFKKYWKLNSIIQKECYVMMI